MRWSRSAPNFEKMSLRSGRDVLMECRVQTIESSDRAAFSEALRGPKAGRVATATSFVLSICAASFGAGCASGSRFSPNVPQSPTGVQRERLIPGSWDKVVALRPASRVVVTLISGERLEGAFRNLGPGDLNLIDSAGRDFSVVRSNIRQIVARGERDGLTNGALIGAGIGLGTAAIILAVIASGEGYVLASVKWGAPLLMSAVGGVVGIFVDRAHRDDQVVYVGA